jgi:hypothetical protein
MSLLEACSQTLFSHELDSIIDHKKYTSYKNHTPDAEMCGNMQFVAVASLFLSAQRIADSSTRSIGRRKKRLSRHY